MTSEARIELRRKIWVVSLPIIVEFFINAAISSADVVMTTFIGQTALSSLSLAAQYSSIILMFFSGINSGVTVLCSQYWGKRDMERIDKVQGIAYRYSISVGSVMTLLCLLIPRQLMMVYTSDMALIEAGAEYLRITSVCFLLWSLSSVYLAALRSIQRAVLSTIAEAAALFLNVTLNAVFIFGLLGAPKLGIRGVALATVISRIAQLAICLVVSARSKDLKLNLGMMFRNDRLLAADYRDSAIPAIGSEVGWGVAFSMYSVIFGHLGSDVVAANSVVSVIRNLGTVLCYGIGSASGIIVGAYLGAGQIEDGKDASRVFLRLSVVSGIIGGLLVAACTPIAMRLVRVSDQAMDYLDFMLHVNWFYLMGTAVNMTLITGILRSGGDARWGFRCDVIGMWCYAVPLGFLAAFAFKLPVKVVYLLICTDEFVKWPWVLRRYYSFKWARNITR